MSRGKTNLFSTPAVRTTAWDWTPAQDLNYYPKVSLVPIMENGDLDGDPLPSRRLFMFG